MKVVEEVSTEEALRALRVQFSQILDRYDMTPEDRVALDRIELEFFQIKSDLLGKLDRLMTALKDEARERSEGASIDGGPSAPGGPPTRRMTRTLPGR